MTQDFNQAAAYLSALGALDTVNEFRAIHETDKGRPAIPRRGTLADLWQELCGWNNQGFGIYVTPAAMDGAGRELENVQAVRAHYVDLDSVGAVHSLAAAEAWAIKPHFVVNTSPGKFHVYWTIAPHAVRERFTLIQRQLVTQFNSDPSVIDATRVLRLPGTLHMKAPTNPTLVTVRQSTGWGSVATSTDTLAIMLHGVEPAQGGHSGDRRAIGEGEQAPSYAEALAALQVIDVTQLTERNEWVSATAAFMQATPPDMMEQARADWLAWNADYPGNTEGANVKLWADTLRRGTSVKGWSTLHRAAYGHAPGKDAASAFAGVTHAPIAPLPTSAGPVQQTATSDAQPSRSMLGTTLFTGEECAQYFRDCVLISSENKILCSDNVFRDSSSFNSRYGGKKFQIGTGEETSGHMTDEPWKAATRSRLWNVPQVAFTCFRPDLEQRAIVTDELGRDYVNIYKPANIRRKQGDPSIFLDHMARILPVESDRHMFLAFLAHNLKYPGHKLFWAPLIQSAEGIGKNAIKRIMQHGIGRMYFYQPKARDLVESGSKFNGWQENKCFFLVDEVRTDERRDMVEILKPFISESEMEIQGKGKDQRMGDTPGNWLFFSNWKDAIPINRNGRRHAVYYSALQTADDIAAAGMDKAYFDRLYGWLDDGGVEIVVDWLMRWDLECGALPVRAPETSSTAEALAESHGWLETLILECVDESKYGFRGGWVSTKMIALEVTALRKNVATKTIAQALGNLGYNKVGRVGVATGHPEDQRPYVWAIDAGANIADYPQAQGRAF